MDKLNIALTVDETNLILKCLSQRPFAEVSGVITAIQQQANQQLAPKKPEPLHQEQVQVAEPE